MASFNPTVPSVSPTGLGLAPTKGTDRVTRPHGINPGSRKGTLVTAMWSTAVQRVVWRPTAACFAEAPTGAADPTLGLNRLWRPPLLRTGGYARALPLRRWFVRSTRSSSSTLKPKAASALHTIAF